MAEDPLRRLREAISGLIDRLTGKPKRPGTADSPLTWPNDERHRVAVHEAGHAVVAWSMVTVAEVSSIALTPGGNGMTTWTGNRRLHSTGHPLAAWERCAVCFGGIAAEACAYGDFHRHGSAHDLYQARTTARGLAEASMMYPGVLSSPWGTPPDEVQQDFDKLFTRPIPFADSLVLKAGYFRACAMVYLNRPALFALADEANSRRVMDARAIARVLGPRPWAIEG